MSRTISFRYDYPYCGYRAKAKYGNQWASGRTTLNDCNTYPMVFNNTVPSCSHIKIDIEITNTGSGTVYGRSWDFMVYRQSYGWVDILTFTLPSDGKYTIDCDMPGHNITKFAFVPSSNPGSNRTWDSWFDVKQLSIAETVTTANLTTGEFQYGIFPNYYGVSQQINETYVNIGGTLTKDKDILINIDGTLTSIPPVYSGYFKSTSEQMKVFEFTPMDSASYMITQKRVAGDHEIRLYDSGFNQMSDGYFYNQAFALTGGSLYYISVTHYYNNESAGESWLQVHKI